MTPIEITFTTNLPTEPGLWLNKDDLGVRLFELTFSGADLTRLPSELGVFRRGTFVLAVHIGGEWCGPLVISDTNDGANQGKENR